VGFSFGSGHKRANQNFLHSTSMKIVFSGKYRPRPPIIYCFADRIGWRRILPLHRNRALLISYNLKFCVVPRSSVKYPSPRRYIQRDPPVESIAAKRRPGYRLAIRRANETFGPGLFFGKAFSNSDRFSVVPKKNAALSDGNLKTKFRNERLDNIE